MEEEEKIKYTFVKFLLFLFIAFIIVYFSNVAGFYEYKTYTKTKITEKAIKEFEKDVEDGKNISINNYLENEYEDYSNVISRMGNKISSFGEDIMNFGIKKSLKLLSELFYE